MNEEMLSELIEEIETTEPIEAVEAVEENEPIQLPDADRPDPILSELTTLRGELSELRRELNLRRRADEVNERNATLSAGRVGTSLAPEYYTPDEVRAMSQTEVRENYEKIRASMKKWH